MPDDLADAVRGLAGVNVQETTYSVVSGTFGAVREKTPPKRGFR
jgi:hypothetical protein